MKHELVKSAIQGVFCGFFLALFFSIFFVIIGVDLNLTSMQRGIMIASVIIVVGAANAAGEAIYNKITKKRANTSEEM